MRTLFSLATVLLFVGSAAAAPVPTTPPPQTLDGKYTLLSVSSPADRANAAGGGGFGGVGGPGGGPVMVRASGLTASSLLAGPAVFTKGEITLEGRGSSLPPTTMAMLGLSAGPTAMEYTFDPAKMTIDVETVSLRGKKTKSLGLVEVVGDRVIIAVAKEGDERPKNTDEAGDVTVYYFRKAPAPKTEFRIVAMTVGKEEQAEKELNQLAKDGYELVSTTAAATDAKSSPTTVHFVLKRTTGK